MELTKEFLKKLGFLSVYKDAEFDDESAFFIRGSVDDEHYWKVCVDFMMPNVSYVINTQKRKSYEGAITTVEDLEMLVKLCEIPIELNK